MQRFSIDEGTQRDEREDIDEIDNEDEAYYAVDVAVVVDDDQPPDSSTEAGVVVAHDVHRDYGGNLTWFTGTQILPVDYFRNEGEETYPDLPDLLDDDDDDDNAQMDRFPSMMQLPSNDSMIPLSAGHTHEGVDSMAGWLKEMLKHVQSQQPPAAQ